MRDELPQPPRTSSDSPVSLTGAAPASSVVEPKPVSPSLLGVCMLAALLPLVVQAGAGTAAWAAWKRSGVPIDPAQANCKAFPSWTAHDDRPHKAHCVAATPSKPRERPSPRPSTSPTSRSSCPATTSPPRNRCPSCGSTGRAASGGSRSSSGVIPSWADDPAIGNRLINARAETVAEKPAFRAAFKRRRASSSPTDSMSGSERTGRHRIISGSRTEALSRSPGSGRGPSPIRAKTYGNEG